MKVLEREEVYHKLLEGLSKEEHEQGMRSGSGPALIYGEEGPRASGSLKQWSLRAADLPVGGSFTWTPFLKHRIQ